jgi:AcrR family transcriptional regulator
MARIQTDKDVSRKDVIVKAAAELFKEKGYKAASMRDLAVKVGVEAASLYNHIRSKSELLHDICFDAANHYGEHMTQVENSNATPLEKVEMILRFQINQMINNYAEVSVADNEWKHLTDPYLSNYQTQRHNYRRRLNAIITKGIDDGEIKNVNVPSTIWLLLHAVSGIESWHRSKTRVDAKELEENMVSILIGGLKKA